MSKKKTTPATKSENQQANSGPERGWIKPRTGLLVMALASVAFAVFVILTGLKEGMSFGEVLPTAGIYMLMMWGVFGIMMLFFRFTRRR